MSIEKILEKYQSGQELSAEEKNIFESWLKENGVDPNNFKEVDNFLLKEQENNKSESKSLNSQETKALLADYEEHLEKLGDNKKALDQLIKDNPMFKRQTVLDLIEAQSKLVAEGVKKPDEVLIKAEEINERVEIDDNEALELAKKIVESNDPQQIEKELKGKVSEEVAEVLEEIVTEIEVEEKIKIAEEKVEVVVEKTTDEILEEINKEFNEEISREEIREEVRERVEKVINDPSVKLDDIVDGATLTTKIVGGLKISGPENIEKISGTIRNKSVEISKKQIGGQLGKDLDEIRKLTSWEQIYERTQDKGIANLVTKVGYVSVTEELMARDGLKENNYSPENAAGYQAPILKHYVGLGNIKENVEKIDGVRKKLEGLEIFDKIDPINKLLKGNPALTSSLQRVQQLLNTRNLMYKSVGWAAQKFGVTLSSEGLINWGTQIVTKFGGEQIVGAMATHLAEFGMEGGMKSILSQLLTKGTVTAVTGMATAGGVATAGTVAAGVEVAAGPPGWVLLAVQAVITAAVMIGGQLFKVVKGLWNKINEGLGLNGPLDDVLKDTLGGFVGGIASFGTKVGIGVAAMAVAVTGAVSAVSITVIVVIVLIVVFGGNMATNYWTAMTIISPLVMNMESGTMTGENGEEVVLANVVVTNPVSTVPLPPLDPNVAIPVGCPMGLPITGGVITQGYRAPNCSHVNMGNAIDFGAGAGTQIRTTHNGLARAGSNNIYGNYVDVTGVCGGTTFTTRYAHMPAIPFGGVREVKSGDVIGQVDNTGSSTGNHLHYDIRDGNLPLRFEYYLGLKNSISGCCIDNGNPCPQN